MGRKQKFPDMGKLSYGGALSSTRIGRSHGRPLATRQTMHMVLRSTKARGEWSLKRPRNKKKIQEILRKFGQKYDVKVHDLAHASNHLHLEIQLSRVSDYKPFVRAITAAIAMAVTGACRWRPMQGKFWDQRPFTRVVVGLKQRITLRNYLALNRLEAIGFSRPEARFALEWNSS